MRMNQEFIQNAEIRENTLVVKYDKGALDIGGKVFVSTEVSGVGSGVRQFMISIQDDEYQSKFEITEWVENVFNDTLVPLLGDIDPDSVVAFLGDFKANEVDPMRYKVEFTITFERTDV